MLHRPAPCVFGADARDRPLWASLDLEGEVLLLRPRGAHLEASQGLGLLPLPTRVRTPRKKPHVPQTPKMEVRSPACGFPSLTTGGGGVGGGWAWTSREGGVREPSLRRGVPSVLSQRCLAEPGPLPSSDTHPAPIDTASGASYCPSGRRDTPHSGTLPVPANCKCVPGLATPAPSPPPRVGGPLH